MIDKQVSTVKSMQSCQAGFIIFNIVAIQAWTRTDIVPISFYGIGLRKPWHGKIKPSIEDPLVSVTSSWSNWGAIVLGKIPHLWQCFFTIALAGVSGPPLPNIFFFSNIKGQVLLRPPRIPTMFHFSSYKEWGGAKQRKVKQKGYIIELQQ